MTDSPHALNIDALEDIDAQSPVALYRQISDQLAARILDVQPGVRLPSEFEIVQRLGVSRATATQALRDLEQRGLVYRRQGKGTFVADTGRAIRSNISGSLPSFSEDLRRAGRTTRERVIALDIAPSTAEVTAALNLSPNDEVWRVERVIVSDTEPVVHVTSWLPCSLYRSLTKSAIEKSSLYEQLAATPDSPGRPCSADEQWSAASAPPVTAGLLELVRGTPVMRVVRTAFLHDHTPAEYVISYVRGETFAVSMHIDAHSRGSRVLSHLTIASH